MLFIPKKLKQTLKPLKSWVLHPIGEDKLMRQYQKASRKIFIDCGANTGKVLENAMKKRKGFEFYAFDPQPELVELGNRIKTGYPFVPFHFYPKAVWTDDGKLNFFRQQETRLISTGQDPDFERRKSQFLNTSGNHSLSGFVQNTVASV